MKNKRRYLFRIITPAFSEFNIYTRQAKKTTALGPICVATSANELTGWDVEVIDENNLAGKYGRYCPKDENGRPDHKKLQEIRPADAVGFYCSLSSTMPGVFKLAEMYKQWGIFTIAGGKHVEALPEESLRNNIDVVSFGDGEATIKKILLAWQNDQCLDAIDGIAFQKNGQLVKNIRVDNQQQPKLPEADLESLPFPDFSLLLYADVKIYPICWFRGCAGNCEFCVVKSRVRCSPAEKLYNNVVYLAETRGARDFFIVDDHFGGNIHNEQNRREAKKFCRLISAHQERTGIKLWFTVQIRLNTANYPDLLEVMRKAGIKLACIGYESPIDEELRAMRKGYLSKKMLKWTQVFHEFGFFVHGMFMFGYPRKEKLIDTAPITLEERVKKFRNFIDASRMATAQVLLTVPLPGTELRKRLEEEGRIFPLDKIGWEYYDGQFPTFVPDDNISPKELQQAMSGIMSKFYHIHHVWALIGSFALFVIFHLPAVFTLLMLRVRYIIAIFRWWKKEFFRNPNLGFWGHFVFTGWEKKFKKSDFPEKLKRAEEQLLSQKKPE